MTVFYRVARAICRAVFRVIFPFKIVGRENIPKDGAFIISANHISLLDAVFLGIAVKKRQIFFMSKYELFRNKLFGLFLYKLGAFPVIRGSGNNDAMEKAKSILKDGNIVGIFPEGTRSKNGQLGRPRSGAIVLSHSESVPIIPAAIVCKGQKARPFQKYTVVILPKIEPDNCEKLDFELKKTLIDRLMSKISGAIDTYGEKTG